MLTERGYLKSRFLDNKLCVAILLAYAKDLRDRGKVLDAIRERLGLSSGPLGSIGHWLGSLLHGDPGIS